MVELTYITLTGYSGYLVSSVHSVVLCRSKDTGSNAGMLLTLRSYELRMLQNFNLNLVNYEFSVIQRIYLRYMDMDISRDHCLLSLLTNLWLSTVDRPNKSSQFLSYFLGCVITLISVSLVRKLQKRYMISLTYFWYWNTRQRLTSYQNHYFALTFTNNNLYISLHLYGFIPGYLVLLQKSLSVCCITSQIC